MRKRDFNDFCDELEDLVESYTEYDDSWSYNEKWFSNGQGAVEIEIDTDIEENYYEWESDFWSDFEDLCAEWGADYDSNDSIFKVGFNL